MKVFLLRATMMLLPIMAAILALTLSASAADEGAVPEPAVSISKLKARVPDTALVTDGAPSAEIVVPGSKAYEGLGIRVRAAIETSTGARLPIRKDSEFAGEYGVPKQVPAKNLIVLGNMESSNLIALLYARRLCAEDAIYPGKGGCVVRTVNDPWGNGTNVIILGGSDLEGVEDAVELFTASMPAGKTVRYPGALLTRFTPALVERFSELGKDPSDAEIAEQLLAADKAFRAGVHSGLFPQITAAGYGFLRTGHGGYVRLFRDMIFLAHDLYNQNLGTYGGPWGMDADFKFWDLIATWDTVEESDVLSDDDRLRITNIILEYIRYWETYWSVSSVGTPDIRNNHTTFTSLGFMFAADYFGRHYRLPQAEKWMAIADGCFRSQMKAFKPQEDSNSYQWITLHHMMIYALARPNPEYIKSGLARIGGDLAIMTMDNLGYQTSFGDVGGFHGGNVEMYLWRPLAAVTGDGRYMWAYLKGYGARPNAGMNAYHNSVAPKEPVDLLGVRWLPTDKAFYGKYNGKGTVPQERTFEKISFRTSFDAEKPYMLLDGITGCGHGHSDGNSVLRFSDKGRIWLGDCDYIKAQPKFHNMLSVFRDGQSFPLPTFSEREIVADLGNVAFTRTSTPGCSGTDWTRSIFWDRGSTFVFVDEVAARVDDEFSVRCFWQALGDPKIEGNSFTVTQGGPSMTIRNLDGARVRTWDDAVTGKNWAAYTKAEPIIRVVQQIKTRRLKEGQLIRFLNVITTQAEGEAPVAAERVNDSTVILGAGDDRSIVGIRAADAEIAPGIATDGGLFWLNRRYIAVGRMMMLALNSLIFVSSDKPISVELEAGGRIVFDAEDASTIHVRVGEEGVRLDGKPVKGRVVRGVMSLTIPAGRSILEGADLPDEFAITFPTPRPARAESVGAAASGVKSIIPQAGFKAPDAGTTFSSVASDAGRVYLGGSDGKVRAVGLDGTQAWEFFAAGEVKAVWVGRLAKDEPRRIAVGTAEGIVFLLDEAGKELWKTQLPYYKRIAKVVYFSSADLEGDGNRALIVGSENWHHYALDSKGAQLWKYESIHASTAGCPADLDGDGREEFIAGTEYYWWHGVSPAGQKLWQYRTPTGPRATSVVAGDAAGTGAPGIFFGGADGNVHAVSREGALLWQYSTGDEISGLALGDLDADGRPEIVAGSLSFNVLAIKGDGKKLWRADLGEPVKALVLADLDGDGAVEVCAGTEDGRVVVLDRAGKTVAEWRAPAGVARISVIPGAPGRLACVTTDGGLAILAMR